MKFYAPENSNSILKKGILNLKIQNENRLYTLSVIVVCLILFYAIWFWSLRQLQAQVLEAQTQIEELESKIETVEQAVYTVETTAYVEEEVEVDNSFYLTDEERRIAESMVAGEAGNQSLFGKQLVAQCIREACQKDGLQPSEVRTKYQYSGWAPEWETNHPEKWAEVEQAVQYIFDEGQNAVDDIVLWFYNPSISAGKFHKTQRFVIEEGDHVFVGPWN